MRKSIWDDTVTVFTDNGRIFVCFTRKDIDGEVLVSAHGKELLVNRITLDIDLEARPLGADRTRVWPRANRSEVGNYNAVPHATQQKATALLFEAIDFALADADADALADAGVRRAAREFAEFRRNASGALPRGIVDHLRKWADKVASEETWRRIADGGPLAHVSPADVAEDLRAALLEGFAVALDPKHAYEVCPVLGNVVYVLGGSAEEVARAWRSEHPDQPLAWVRTPDGELVETRD